MTDEQKVLEKKTFTHTVHIPLNTDVPEMIGAYRALLESLEINTDLMSMFPINPQGFSHPVVECQEKLKHDFMQTMQLLTASKQDHNEVFLENITVTTAAAVFILYYME